MEAESLALILGALVVFLLGVLYFVQRVLVVPIAEGTDILWMPDPVEDAIRYAANYVEQLDRAGAFDDLKEKGKEKLATAVDVAAQKLEQWAADAGFNINIPESTIKDLIQRYVWENPDLFPTRGDNGADGQTE